MLVADVSVFNFHPNFEISCFWGFPCLCHHHPLPPLNHHPTLNNTQQPLLITSIHYSHDYNGLSRQRRFDRLRGGRGNSPTRTHHKKHRPIHHSRQRCTERRRHQERVIRRHSQHRISR